MGKLIDNDSICTKVLKRNCCIDEPKRDYTCVAESTKIDLPVIDFLEIKEEQVKIGEIEAIPDSVLYDPIKKAKYCFLQVWPGKFQVVDNLGVCKKNASTEDQCLAKYSAAVADKISNIGSCYTGVKKSFLSAGIIDNYDDMPRGDAKDSIPYFDSHPERFKKIEVSKDGIKNLPAGRICVCTNGDKAGHIFVTNGYKQGMSSATDNLGWLDAEGDSAQYVVYELTDKWKYNPETLKLEFCENS